MDLYTHATSLLVDMDIINQLNLLRINNGVLLWFVGA